MHYDSVENRHGLKHDPFKAIVTPRPIGWIGSVSGAGVCNLAPYSFFNAVSDRPHYVAFSSNGLKDSVRNVEETGEFTFSLSTWDLRQGMNISSAPVPADVDEFPVSNLTAAASHYVVPPRVKESPAALECRFWKTVEMPDADRAAGTGHYVVFGHVVGIYIDDAYIHDGIVDTGAMRPLARLGYMDYASVSPETVFTLNRPLVAEDGTVSSPSGDWDGVYR